MRIRFLGAASLLAAVATVCFFAPSAGAVDLSQFSTCSRFSLASDSSFNVNANGSATNNIAINSSGYGYFGFTAQTQQVGVTRIIADYGVPSGWLATVDVSVGAKGTNQNDSVTIPGGITPWQSGSGDAVVNLSWISFPGTGGIQSPQILPQTGAVFSADIAVGNSSGTLELDASADGFPPLKALLTTVGNARLYVQLPTQVFACQMSTGSNQVQQQIVSGLANASAQNHSDLVAQQQQDQANADRAHNDQTAAGALATQGQVLQSHYATASVAPDVSASAQAGNFLSYLTGFVGAVSAASPSNCNLSLPFPHGGSTGSMNMCSAPIGSSWLALITLVVALALVPVAIKMVRKIVALWGEISS